jgi:hypothetical protein
MMKKLITILIAITTTVLAQSQTYNDTIPIRISSFNATNISNNNIKLNWKIVCFLEFANFQVQRSTDGINYTTINMFQSDRLRCKEPFDFEDQNIGGKIYYRINVGDKEGKFSTSKIVVLTGKTKPFEIVSLSPSIVINNAQLMVSSANIDKAEILITNIQAVVIKRIYTTLNPGANYINIDANNLAKGYYNISIYNTYSNMISTHFIKQ